MISFILGVLTTLIVMQYLKPRPVVVYKEDALDRLGYEAMSSQFSTTLDEVRYAWDVEKLWVEFESLEAVEWKIPKSFQDEWYWGQSHPSDHIERCLEADLNYPILVWDDAIIDGTHRTVKALAQGKKTIKARVIINMPPPDEQTDLKPDESGKGIPWTNGDMVKLVQAFTEYEELKSYDFRHPLDP